MSNFIAKAFNDDELEKLLQDCISYHMNNIFSISFQMIAATQEKMPIIGIDNDNENNNVKFELITGMLFSCTVIFIAASAYAVFYANFKTSFFKKDKTRSASLEKASVSSSDCTSTKGDACDDETLQRINPDASSSFSSSKKDEDEMSSCASYDYSVQPGNSNCSLTNDANSFCGSSIDNGELDSICDKVGSILDDLDATHIITTTIQQDATTPMVSNSLRKKSLNQSNNSSFNDIMGLGVC